MLVNISKKEKAITLRKQGKTYSEILKEVDIAKSTLSDWLRDVGLSKKHFQKLTKKRVEAAKRGGQAKREQRIQRTRAIQVEASKDVEKISKKDLWLIGIILYWAEGTKEKDYRHGAGINFNNSDPRMIRVFIVWLLDVCKISKDRITCEIYIHENSKNKVEDARKYWSRISSLPIEKFDRVYFKKNKIKTNRKNVGDLYYGLLRVKVRASSTLLRQVAGWTDAIVRHIT